ncbi:MAG: hypothetical protein AAF702_29080 [Chloroflexota bacterium]
MSFPIKLQANLYTGNESESTGEVGDGIKRWGITARLGKYPIMADAPRHVNLRHWQDPNVGWGLILPDNPELSDEEKAEAIDAPDAIRRLLAHRPDSPVFRYQYAEPNHLHGYYKTDGYKPVFLTGVERGSGVAQLPHYLLIYASPEEIPWRFQYLLNQTCFVGRLDLDPEGLNHYVDALIHNWVGMDSRPYQPVVWSVDHNNNDITYLMRKSIAEPIASDLIMDSDIQDSLTALYGKDATEERLIEELQKHQPALIITTSHGRTGPLNNMEKLASQLGFPVDQNHVAVTPNALLDSWEPCGAIWYAHACCSAGSDSETSYGELIAAFSSLQQSIESIQSLGSLTAPLPKRLLGAEKPLRAFIGHVEPTFDWTLEHPLTGQFLTSSIRKGLYDHLYQSERETIGMALKPIYSHIGSLMTQWEMARHRLTDSNAQVRQNAQEDSLLYQLMGLDRRSMVILGDPTACLPQS